MPRPGLTRADRVLQTIRHGWRPDPGRPTVAGAALEELATIALADSTAGLLWRAIRAEPAQDPSEFPVRAKLQQWHRRQTLLASVQRRWVEETFERLDRLGVQGLVAKGWAVARHYPEPGCRPVGDVDLYVSPRDYGVVLEDLRRNRPSGPVDLHSGCHALADLSWEQLLSAAERVPLAPQPRPGARTHREASPLCFGHADHLRLLCLHALKHGVERSIWLCDIAVMIERAPPNLDWDRVLAGPHGRWTACMLEAAVRLLDARVPGDRPWSRVAPDLPAWFVPAVRGAWMTPFTARRPMVSSLASLAGLRAGLVRRWPNPLEATFGVGGPLNGLPRLPFQIAECIRRIAASLPRFCRVLLRRAARRVGDGAFLVRGRGPA